MRRRRKHPSWGYRWWIVLAPENGGHWIWNGAHDRDGYGRTGYKFALAHRWVYEQLVAPIPPGLEIDHTCFVRDCVNPAHLEPVTHAENERRKYARMRVRRQLEQAA